MRTPVFWDTVITLLLLWSGIFIDSLVRYTCCDFSKSTSSIFRKFGTDVHHLLETSVSTFQRWRSKLKVKTAVMSSLPLVIAQPWFKIFSANLPQQCTMGQRRTLHKVHMFESKGQRSKHDVIKHAGNSTLGLWNVLDRFSPNLYQGCIMGQIWMLWTLRSEGHSWIMYAGNCTLKKMAYNTHCLVLSYLAITTTIKNAIKLTIKFKT